MSDYEYLYNFTDENGNPFKLVYNSFSGLWELQEPDETEPDETEPDEKEEKE